MSYIAAAIKMVAEGNETETNDTQTRLDYMREKTEADSSFLNFLIPVAGEVAKKANALAYRFHIGPNNTIH